MFKTGNSMGYNSRRRWQLVGRIKIADKTLLHKKRGSDIIKNAYHKIQNTKRNKLCHDESLLNINTARRYTAVFRKSTFTTAIFFLYQYTGLPYVQYVVKQLLGLPRFQNLLLTFCDRINTICTIIQQLFGQNKL